jgi:hypothetical protein
MIRLQRVDAASATILGHELASTTAEALVGIVLKALDSSNNFDFAIARRAVGQNVKYKTSHSRRRVIHQHQDSIPDFRIVPPKVAGTKRPYGLRSDPLIRALGLGKQLIDVVA